MDQVAKLSAAWNRAEDRVQAAYRALRAEVDRPVPDTTVVVGLSVKYLAATRRADRLLYKLETARRTPAEPVWTEYQLLDVADQWATVQLTDLGRAAIR